MTASPSYVIRGGIEGRERLRLLARVMRPTTSDLFRRVGLRSGMTCLDVGCGGGDVTVDLARAVAPAGFAVGTDIDEIKLELARAEATEQQVSNVEFTVADASGKPDGRQFDVVYARFLLTHLPDAAGTLANMVASARPGGVVILEDIDFTGSFCSPRSEAYDRYVELYTSSVVRRGADPNIGPRLPAMLIAAGCDRVDLNVVQPAGVSGEAKVVTPLTMENIAEAIRLEGLADVAEIDALVSELYELAYDTTTVMSLPRVVQAWGFTTAL